MSAFAIVLALGSPAIEPPIGAVSHNEMRTALNDCGLHHLRITYESDLQSDMVWINDTQVTDDQLECAFLAQDGTGYLLDWHQTIRPRYHSISSVFWQEREMASAETYFADRPELGAVPIRAAGQSELDFAREIERFCGGIAAGFTGYEYGTITISADWLLAHPIDGDETFGCMMNAFAIRNLKFGFIGNGLAAQEP